MSFTLELRTERNELIERDAEAPWELAAAMPAQDRIEYRYLRLVDPYGTTVFSSHQMIAVVPELTRLAVERPLASVKRALELARKCEAGTHYRLVFIGD